MDVKTAQPDGVQLQMQQQPMQQMTTVNVPQGLPPGLQYLAQLNEILIQQHLDLLEVATGCERNNKYKICNANDQQFMYAKEDTDCMTRQCCGPARPFDMQITDNNFQPLISLYRPLRCQAWLGWCCCLQEMDIMSPPGVSVGTVKQLWTPWSPKFQVFDANQQPIYEINGECCFCVPCNDIHFTITDLQRHEEIGQIIKTFNGCAELWAGVNNFRITFPVETDVMKKALLLGATFLIDFNYFERNKN